MDCLTASSCGSERPPVSSSYQNLSPVLEFSESLSRSNKQRRLLPYSLKLIANDAKECRSQQGSVNRWLQNATDEHINVVHVFVQGLESRHVHGGEHLGQHLPGLDPGLAAQLAPGVVGSEAVVPASLNVEADQVEAEALVLLLEQVLGQLGGECGVQLLGLLGGQAADEGLECLVVVELVRGELGLCQGHGLDLAPEQIEAVDGPGDQAVTKSIIDKI